MSIRTEIDIEGGTDFVSLNPIRLFSVPYALYAESSGDSSSSDADSDPTNEIQTLGRDSNMITLTDGGSVEDLVEDGDADPLNEIQTLQLNLDNELSILDAEGNIINQVTIPVGGDDGDADPLNELQTLGRDGNMITLSDGGMVEDLVEDDDSDPTNETQYFGVTGEQLQLLNQDGSIESSIDFETIVDLGGAESPWEEDTGLDVVSYDGLAELNDEFGNQAHLQGDNLHFHTGGNSYIFAYDGAYYTGSGNSVALGLEGLVVQDGSITADYKAEHTILYNPSLSTNTKLEPGFLTLEDGGDDLEIGLISGVAEIATPNATHMVFQTSGFDRLTIEPNGDVGIGTFFPDNKLDIDGNVVFYPVRIEGAGSTEWQMGVSGANFYRLYPGGAQWASLDANTLTWSVNSDKRLKTDISSIESTIDKIMKLDVKRYRYKDRSKKVIGLIAQDVEKVFPELVSDDQISEENTETVKSLNYSSFIYINMKAIQELNTKIVDQEEKIKSQQEIIDSLVSRIEAFENK